MKDINKVTLTLTVNGVDITRNYEFAFGKFEDKDWDTEVVDMYGTYLDKLEDEPSDNEDQLHLEALRRDL